MAMMGVLHTLRKTARRLKAQVYVLYLASRHPRTPRSARLVVMAVLAYALSPIDLVPDFIPVLGYLDDIILLPLGIALALKLIPSAVLSECRERARNAHSAPAPASWKAGGVIIMLWLLTALLVTRWVWALFIA
jgi:uncharacterized membrane protein YkvA (DUF1232 family)